MVTAFRRSISMPKPAKAAAPEKSYHVRSTSLPTLFHPLISQLQDQIATLRAWQSSPDHLTSAGLCAGLRSLKVLHDAFDDFLHLPQTRASLRLQPHWVDALLDHCLRLADAFGILRAALVVLRQHSQAAQVGIRSRRDGQSCLHSYFSCRRRLHKEVLPTLLAALKGAAFVPAGDGDAKLAAILRDVSAVTLAVSAAVFDAVSVKDASTSWFVGLKRTRSKEERGLPELRNAAAEELRQLMKREEKTALRKLEELEDCVAGIEMESEKVFRSFISIRVSLLNVLTL